MRDMIKTELFKGAIVVDTTARGEVVTDAGDVIGVGHDWLTHHSDVIGKVIRKAGATWEAIPAHNVEDVPPAITDEEALAMLNAAHPMYAIDVDDNTVRQVSDIITEEDHATFSDGGG